MQEHSPFEPGYVGNSDPGAMVGVLDVTFPRERLLGAGADEALIDRITTELEGDQDLRRRVIELFETATDEQLVEVLAAAQDRYDREDAFAALPEEDRAVLEALSEDEQEALAALTDEERAALTAAPDGAVPEVPKGTVDEVLAWVGDDTGRAALALAVEEQAADPRVTLVKPLQEMLTPAADDGQQ